MAACEVEPFDPRGYRCETDLNCLPEYYCNRSKKLCEIVPVKEKAPADAAPDRAKSDAPSKDDAPTPRDTPPAERTESTPEAKADQ